MIFLGLDPSLTSTGWAVLDDEKIVRVGKVPTNTGQFMGQRLSAIANAARVLAIRHTPDDVAIEGLGLGSMTLAISAEVAGVIRLALASVNGREYQPAVIRPSSLKRWACGDGRADKSQMIAAARIHANYRGRSHDEADAVLVAAWLRHQHRVGADIDKQRGAV